MDGILTFYVRVQDKAGNNGSYGSHQFKIDTTGPPAPVITADSYSLYWSPPSDLSGISGYYYKVDDGAEVWTNSISVTISGPSMFSIPRKSRIFWVKAQDNAGNFGPYGYYDFTSG